MIYPRIPRRSIALLILCLIFTLVAVGFSFLIYFFYSTTDFMDNLRNSFAINNGQYHHYPDTDEFGPYTHFLANDIGTNGHHGIRHFPFSNNNNNNNNNNGGGGGGKIENGHLEMGHTNTMDNRNGGDSGSVSRQQQGFKYINNNNGIDNRLINNGETIYIDDYDKINEKSVTGLDGTIVDMTNIEYFDQIISDHSNNNNNNNNKNNNNNNKNNNNNNKKKNIDATKSIEMNKMGSMIDYQKSATDIKNILIFTKDIDERGQNNHARQSPRIIQAKADIEIQHIDDDGDDDDTNVSSGSGDFANNDSVVRTTRLTQYYRNQNNKENIYSISSELLTNFDGNKMERNSTEIPLQAQIDYLPDDIKHNDNDDDDNYDDDDDDDDDIDENESGDSSKTDRTNYKTDATTTMDSLIIKASNRNLHAAVVPSLISKKITTIRQHNADLMNGRDQQHQQRRMYNHKNGAWLETRARRILGNVEKSEERSRQLLLCEEAGGGELCRMLFKGRVNE